MPVTAYPLTWPDGWPRTKNTADDRFKTTLHAALANVEGSLRRFATDSGKKVENLVVSSNYSLTDRRPADAGVAVYFTWDGISTCIAVDRYGKLEANLQALHHCIEAERTKLRHGGLNLVRAAFRGYAALPPPSASNAPHWSEVLGLPRTATRDEIAAAWRERARTAHPDAGGSQSSMAALNAAKDAALQEAPR